MKSIKAIWNGVVIAESDTTVQVEGNYYFPKEAIDFELLRPSDTTTHCPWKGDAAYHTIVAGGEENTDAVWSYPDPSREALQLKDHYAFWKGVEIVRESTNEKNQRYGSMLAELREQLAQAGDDGMQLVTIFRAFLEELGEDGLTHTLPTEYVNSLSFFNFYNSNDACFQTDVNHKIQRVNRTFAWAFNHIPEMVGETFETFMKNLEIVEGDDPDAFFKRIESHGWAQLPKIRVPKDGKDHYYRMDVAITKHGDTPELSGFQCQLKNITCEVELAQSVERSKANMDSLLCGIDIGLFYFDADGNIAPERSQAMASILPGSDTMTTIHDVVCEFSHCDRPFVDETLALLWPDDESLVDMFDVAITMLPERGTVQKEGETRDIVFRYNPLLTPDGKLEKVIVVATDVTAALRSEREAAKQTERVEKISLAVANTEGYKNFVDEAVTEGGARNF